MRTRRLKIPPDRPTGFYHCLSRIVDRRRIFEAPEKEHFVALMRECERFCRVRVLTFAVMSNHFHILLEVPKRPEVLPGPDEIIQDLERLSGHQFPGVVRQRFDLFRETNDEAGLAAYLATFHARMYDVSAFIKLLKQRFTQWYNGRTDRKGTLWEGRFRSVLVDGAGEALTTMAAYIDLNPVRAGIVKDPKDYRWCGYGEAVAGLERAQTGLQFLTKALRCGVEEDPARSLEVYRTHLYLEGDEQREATGPDGKPVRGALSREEAIQVLKASGRLPAADFLRCRVRYFCDGLVFGRREFVEDMFREHRANFGARRKTGARRVRGLSQPSLYSLRNLRLSVFG